MSFNSKERGVGSSEIDDNIATFVFAVQRKFFSNSSILDLEDAAIELVSLLDSEGREAAITTLKAVKDIGIRGCLERLVSEEEILKIDKEETKRLIDFLQYSGSTPG